MENLQKSMKYSLIFGIIGAILVPLTFEIYANVSRGIGLFLLGIWTVTAGIKFSALKFKEAFIGMTCTVAYSGILGFIFYVLIHPAVKKALEKNSVYFQLSLSEEAYFVLYAAIIMLCIYLVWIAKTAFSSALRKLISNREQTGEYIENAFNDEKEDNK